MFKTNSDDKWLSKKEKLIIFGFFLLLIFSFFFDDSLLGAIDSLRLYPLNAIMLFITDFGLLYCIIIVGVYLILQKKYQHIALLMLTAAASLEVSYLLKILFQTPRPFAAAIVATIPLTQASGYAMPSLHAAVCFSFWPYINQIFADKKRRILGYSIIVFIAFSRLYLGVHYLSDIIAGGIIGYLIAKVWIYLEKEYKVIEWFIYHVKDKLELRRQIAHLLIGALIVFFLKIQLLNEQILFVVLILGGILSVAIKYKTSRKITGAKAGDFFGLGLVGSQCKKVDASGSGFSRQQPGGVLQRGTSRSPLAYLEKILLYFERPGDLKNFPGKGSFFLVLGSLLSVLLFKKEIALAAIAIMAVGDSVTTIVGTYFGKIKNPLNPKKHLEGTLIAIFASTLAAFFFVDFSRAFWASVLGMLFESITIKYIDEVLDDNVMIPLVAGAILTLTA